MRKHIIIVLGVMMLLTSYSFGQSYKSAIGIKTLNAGGSGFFGAGVNLKLLLGGNNALDMSIGGGHRHIVGEIQYEWQKATGWTEGMDWYIGVGAGLGAWSTSPKKHKHYHYTRGFFLGAIANIGLDFNIKPLTGVPLDFALETGPRIGIINSSVFGWGGAFALRYVIK